MRALTIRQPWAWAICHAGKNIENRTYPPPRSVIGQFIAIHAGKYVDKGGIATLKTMGIEVPDEYAQGAIVGVARITGYVHASDNPWFAGPIGWKLADVRAIEPISCRGAQGLWTLPQERELAH